jgi:nucleotide-binding universal stress UspA family protein
MAMGGERERRVVVGVQHSVAGLQALRRGVEEARRHRATLYAVRALAAAGGPYPGFTPWRVELTVWAAELIEQAFAEALGGVPPDVEVRTAALDGAAGPALVAFADRPDDLLVVGCAQRRGLGRARSGWVARYCVRHAACPVLVVPPPPLALVDRRALSRELRRLVDAA